MNKNHEPAADGTAANDGVTASSGTSSLSALAEALNGGRSAEAVALFLAARAQGAVPANGAVLASLREKLGESAAERLVGAFAESGCLYCRRGFIKCQSCDGSGHGESRSEACIACVSLGAVPCDFCGGSGLATYNFVPAGLRTAVAVFRTQVGIAAAAKLDPLPAGLDAALDPRAARKAATKDLARTTRLFGVFKNAADMARRLRRDNAASRNLSCRLFVRSAGGAREAEIRLARLFRRLAALSLRIAEAAEDKDAAAFERDRAAHFEREHRRYVATAARRTSLFPGH